MTEDGQNNPSSAELYEHMEEGHLDDGLATIEKLIAEQEGKKKLQSSTGPTKQGTSPVSLKMKEKAEKRPLAE